MFWQRFVDECNKIGKKPNPVAKEIGITSGTVTGWKKGSIPNTRALNLLSAYFNVSSDYLLGRTDNPSLSESDPATVSERAEIEEEFLAAFEKLTERQKAIALGYMERMAEENKQSKGEIK